MLFEYLKDHTQQLHDATERAAYDNRLGRADITVPEYRQLLLANYHIIAPLEAQLADYESLPEPYRQSYLDRMRTTRLHHDLQQQQVSDSSLDESTPITYLQDVPYAIGAMYVLEGSALGGLHIVKRMRAQPELVQYDHRFYTGWGRESGPMWRKLARQADEMIPEAHYDGALAGARATFERYLSHYDRMLG